MRSSIGEGGETERSCKMCEMSGLGRGGREGSDEDWIKTGRMFSMIALSRVSMRIEGIVFDNTVDNAAM